MRPLAIPDKWVENQTGPWDPTDTFDPTGPNPDVYLAGFDPSADQGLPLQLGVYDGTLAGQSAWPVQTGEAGGTAFRSDIVQCSGYLHSVGDSLPLATGNLIGPLAEAIDELIAQDPGAFWDPTAENGRGAVVSSAFGQSPRVIALPVFAPDSLVPGTASPLTIVKFVGFFVSERTAAGIHGVLTGSSRLTTAAVTARPGEYALLSATFTGPGSPLSGVLIEFLVNDTLVATGLTDGTGTAHPATASYNTGAIAPGQYPGAVRARLGANSGFFVADDATADLTILKKLPVISWPALADVTYGTALGAGQLNAVADVPGQFSYTPASGTVFHAGTYQTITATFVPADLEQYDETSAANYLTVVPAALVATVTDATKLYLDPLPPFGVSYSGFVNGDGPSAVSGSPSFQTSATAASAVGTYPVTVSGLTASDYTVTARAGVLTIVSRPTATSAQLIGPSPATHGQSVSMTVTVSGGAGTPAGSVTLLDAETPIATTPLVNGQAAFTLTSLNAGNHSLSARYSGGSGYATSTSSVVSHDVQKATTTAQLTSSVNPSRVGQAVTFTAVVTAVAPGGGVPTGNVTFTRAGNVLATVPLSNGRAVLTTSSLAVGKHAIQARYVGSGNHVASDSAVLQHTVKNGR